MGWNGQGGGGPWGQGGGSDKEPPRNPWGKPPGGPGKDPKNTPPDLEAWLRDLTKRAQRWLEDNNSGGRRPGGGGSGGGQPSRTLLGGSAVLLLGLWLSTGLYIVKPDQIGVVQRFGRYDRLVNPGLNFILPPPIETMTRPAVTAVNQIQVGMRTGEHTPTRPVLSGISTASLNGPGVAENSLMLTGDENIVDITFSVFWKINDPVKYLFNIRNPEATVRVVSESAMREIIGQLPIRAPLFENRQPIVEQTRIRMQELLDLYNAGISVEQVQLLRADPPGQVIEAFNDVQRARTDQERARNEAETYRNDILPRARGDAQKIIQDAEAYKEQVLNQAQGDSKRFVSVYQSYKVAPDLTARRLYLETVETILKGSNKLVIDPQIKGVTPYLPLPTLAEPRKPTLPTAQPGATP